MKTTTRLNLAWLATLATAANALAGTGVREDTSGLFVWVFLGVCALIVVAQVVPAILMGMGIAKGVAESIRERRRVVAESTVRGT